MRGLEPRLVSLPCPIDIAVGQFQGHWSLCGLDIILPSPQLLLGEVRIRGTRNH